MKRWKLFSIVVILTVLAYLRENSILILNGAINSGSSYKANTEIPEFLYHASPQLLSFAKIGLNFVFLFSILSITYFATKKFFHLKSELNYLKWALILLPLVFMGMFLISQFFSLTVLRGVSLEALWILQTPIPFMIFFGYFYYQQIKKN